MAPYRCGDEDLAGRASAKVPYYIFFYLLYNIYIIYCFLSSPHGGTFVVNFPPSKKLKKYIWFSAGGTSRAALLFGSL